MAFGNLNMNFGGNKAPTEMERVVANMAQVENELTQKLTQLGQMYYLDHKNDAEIEGKYKAIIETMVKLDENRKGFYVQKLRLEGKMMCVNCGEIIPYGSVYCSICGKRADVKEEGENIPAADGQPVKICAKCGEKIMSENVRFCAKCGSPIE